SILFPSQVVPYLGFLADSSWEVFCLKPEKKEKFLQLVREILYASKVTVKTLQRLVGKCVSFSLAVPAAQLFTKQMNAAIAGGQRTPHRLIAIRGDLREEICHWLFLEGWDDPVTWRDERHIRVSVATDASASGWGAILLAPHPLMARLYVFPPMALTGPVLKFLASFKQSCTLVVLDVFPKKYWWPLLMNKAVKSRCLAVCGDGNALLVPSKKGWLPHKGIRGDLWELPVMAKLFVQSVKCPTCGHANDFDFRFCQRCGYKRKVMTTLVKEHSDVIVDLDGIELRLQQLLHYDQATSYKKQKDSLQRELEAFLGALPGFVTLATVTPRDLCRFLIFKDKHGKTQVHLNTCEFLGQRGKQSCGCPLRLSYKTVDSYIGKLRSIFHSIGRDGEWDKRLGLGNPASDKLVKDYLRLVTAEQLQARVTPKQATPFFVDKLTQLSKYLEGELARSKSKLDRFIIARDQAYFKFAFFSGDRPGDLGQVKVPEILRFPNDDGFLFNHIWGKTLRDGDSNVFGVRRNPQSVICPVKGVEQYVEVARELGVDLTKGYLFRPTTSNNGVQDSPFSSSAADARLKVYLKQMKADDGETLHGFHSGCAITLALTGADLSEIMEHVGWARRHTALYYLQLAKVLKHDGPSGRLATPSAENVVAAWQDVNQLKRFVCAFPAAEQRKRPAE
ncbi:unnamed protein product, partial [Porites lobata]